MTLHLRREIENLKRKILSMGARIEDAVAKAVDALQRRDGRLAQSVVEADDQIDRLEVDVEEECLKVLALYQPVAADLRFVVAVLKMNNDLERMGDLAANIAKRAAFLAGQPQADLPFDFSEMAAKAQSMLKQSLDALVNGDAALARQVCAEDDELDEMRRRHHDRIVEQTRRSPQHAEVLNSLSGVNRHLERIGDMATNVCEDVLYMIEGEIMRHGGPAPPND